MLGDIKNNIISFHNKARKTSYAAGSSDLDIAIQLALNDISTEIDCMETEDNSQTLESGDEYIDYPTGYKSLIAITLTDSAGIVYKPLEELKGGHSELRQLKESNSGIGRPEYFSEFNSKFWLYEVADGTYTVKIEYYRIHPQDVSNILLPDFFRNCIYCGTAFFEATLQGNDKYVQYWSLLFQAEKNKVRNLLPKQAYIC